MAGMPATRRDAHSPAKAGHYVPCYIQAGVQTKAGSIEQDPAYEYLAQSPEPEA